MSCASPISSHLWCPPISKLLRGTWLWKLRVSGKSPKVAKIVGRYQYDGISILNQMLWTKILSQTSPPRLANLRYLNLHDWRFLFTERLKSINKRNSFPRTTVKGLQQYRGESTSKMHRLVNNSSKALLTNSSWCNALLSLGMKYESGICTKGNLYQLLRTSITVNDIFKFSNHHILDLAILPWTPSDLWTCTL